MCLASPGQFWTSKMDLTLNSGLTLGKLQSLSFLVSIKAGQVRPGQARPGQGKAGQLPEKPVLPRPLSSWFFWKLSVVTILSSKFGAPGIKMTNFPPNGTATRARNYYNSPQQWWGAWMNDVWISKLSRQMEHCALWGQLEIHGQLDSWHWMNSKH